MIESKSQYLPQKIYVEKQSFDFPLTKRILENLSQVPIETIENPRDLIENIRISRNVREKGKPDLLLTRQMGEFIKPCPCTPYYIGCNYFIINLDLNCPLDCTYCILQQYLSNPLITVHVNLDDLWRQLDVFLHRNRTGILRIGTGELGDSLALDHLTENSKGLISYFREKRNALLELKTKTVNINNILKIEPARNIVIAWSLNSRRIVREEEGGAPLVEERIDAARRVSEKGFRVGFHFDPIIRYPGWEDEYGEVMERLFNAVDPGQMAWISLGSLRFPPSLKTIIKEKFPSTRIIFDELIKGKDGKLRYFKPLRLELYKRIINLIKNCGGEKIPLYFCMESKEIWQRALGWVPKGQESLQVYLSSPFSPLKK